MKDMTYHLSAIEYNETLAVASEELAKKVEHPEIQKWCASVARQHRFHENRHRQALAKLDGGVVQDKGKVHVEAQIAELVPATVEVEVDLGEDNQEN